MSMKIVFLTVLLFCVTNLFAQTNSYTSTKVFNEGEYSYQCDVSSVGNVALYNTSNSWINKEQIVKTTNAIFVYEDFYLDLITDESWTQNRIEFQMIMRNAFVDLDLEVLRQGEELYVNFYINPETGKVDDVRFYFDCNACYTYLPVSFFRQLELAIKERCQYVTTDMAKILNYVYQWDTFKLL